MLRFGCYLSMFHCLKQHESYWPHALLVATFDCHIVFVHLSVVSRLQKGGILRKKSPFKLAQTWNDRKGGVEMATSRRTADLRDMMTMVKHNLFCLVPLIFVTFHISMISLGKLLIWKSWEVAKKTNKHDKKNVDIITNTTIITIIMIIMINIIFVISIYCWLFISVQEVSFAPVVSCVIVQMPERIYIQTSRNVFFGGARVTILVTSVWHFFSMAPGTLQNLLNSQLT